MVTASSFFYYLSFFPLSLCSLILSHFLLVSLFHFLSVSSIFCICISLSVCLFFSPSLFHPLFLCHSVSLSISVSLSSSLFSLSPYLSYCESYLLYISLLLLSLSLSVFLFRFSSFLIPVLQGVMVITDCKCVRLFTTPRFSLSLIIYAFKCQISGLSRKRFIRGNFCFLLCVLSIPLSLNLLYISQSLFSFFPFTHSPTHSLTHSLIPSRTHWLTHLFTYSRILLLTHPLFLSLSHLPIALFKSKKVCFFSATLHSPQISELARKICVAPTWVDLKGAAFVPETVVSYVDIDIVIHIRSEEKTVKRQKEGCDRI